MPDNLATTEEMAFNLTAKVDCHHLISIHLFYITLQRLTLKHYNQSSTKNWNDFQKLKTILFTKDKITALFLINLYHINLYAHL